MLGVCHPGEEKGEEKESGTDSIRFRTSCWAER
jgi:hypothetical protein